MRRVILMLLTGIICSTAFGQDITGQWNGILKVQGVQLRVVFNVSKTDNGYSSTMDSPDQKAKGIPVASTIFENLKLNINVPIAKLEYEGVLNKDSIIIGNLKQGGQLFPMNLSKKQIEKEILLRPQEPIKPYAYHSEEIIFENHKAGIRLAGTLTLPKKEGVYPVVILISGSGPQNRDEEIYGHKPFLVLSNYLTKNGIAVLRYDDRGTALSNGDFKTATSLDFASDVEAGIEYLKTRKEINKKQIGLIGHSEGGIIAPIVASKSKEVAYIVLLAGVGIPGDQLAILQNKSMGKASGYSDEDLKTSELAIRKAFDIINKSTSSEQLDIDLTNCFKQLFKENPTAKRPAGMSDDELVKFQVNYFSNPWMKYFIKYNPAQTLENVKCPVLALNGEKDLQVPPKENLEGIKEALIKGGNNNVTIKEFSNLNHLFQECKVGSLEEYAIIEQTFSPIVLIEISNWIRIQMK